METLIELNHVTVRIGNTEILRDVSVRIPLGRSLFLLGPAGSGKSTLLKVAAGLIPPDEGEVLVGGKSYNKMGDKELADFRTYAGFVFQDAALWENMTILQNMMLPLRSHFPNISDEVAERKVTELLAKVGYKDPVSVRPAELSAGERRLVGFARGLILDPMLLFLDAPLSLVDPSGAKRLIKISSELKKKGKSLTAVTNQLDFAFRLADRLCILENGSVWTEGDIFDVTDRWPEFMEDISPSLQHTLDERRQERKSFES